MNTLVVYDSTFGNTGQIARTIASALGEYGMVRLLRISDAHSLDTHDVDVLIVGGPTQRHGLSPTLRGLFERVPREAFSGLSAVAFDTRYPMLTWKSGSAAGRIASKMKRAGASLLLSPESFFVSGREGPLEEGELKHAREWAGQIARQFETRARRHG
jgi:flavodoxin I